MLAALGSHGRMGLTAVADTHEEADALYKPAVAVFQEEANPALTNKPL